jgi:hypothetical protein
MGGTCSGEMKFRITLRLLAAGASYLGVLHTHGIATSSVCSVCHEGTPCVVITFEFPFVERIPSLDEDALNRVAECFSSAIGGVSESLLVVMV